MSRADYWRGGHKSSCTASGGHPQAPGEGSQVFAVRDDLEARGINGEGCIDGMQMITGRDVAGLLEDYEQVWHW
jgi:sulfur transfer complex TusBCD TusB component (DsrH family)